MRGRRRPRQRDVHLRRPACHEPRRFQVGAEQLLRFRRDFLLAEVHDRPRPRFQVGRTQIAGEYLIEKAAQGVERDVPGVAFAGREHPQDAQRDRLAGLRLIHQRHQQRRRVREAAGAGEELQHFYLGMRPLLDAAVKLEQHAARVEDGGGVAQLDHVRRRVRRPVGRRGQFGGLGRFAAQVAAVALQPAALGRQGGQGGHEGTVAGRVVQRPEHGLAADARLHTQPGHRKGAPGRDSGPPSAWKASGSRYGSGSPSA